MTKFLVNFLLSLYFGYQVFVKLSVLQIFSHFFDGGIWGTEVHNFIMSDLPMFLLLKVSSLSTFLNKLFPIPIGHKDTVLYYFLETFHI